jgi:microcystin-dependent protein
MARNGGGTYTVPNTFVPGATITAASHNQNWADLAAEMTNSLALDGQSAMSGALKAASGSAAAPAVAFASDLDTGAYRSAANEFSVAAGGAQVLRVSAAGVDVASGQLMQAGAALIPSGIILPYAGAAAPDGYLLCYGQPVSRTAYAMLFAAIGTVYGPGDGSGTFNVPDLRGRVVAGQDDMGGGSANRLTGQSGGLDGDTLGAAGGSETHTLTVAQMASHDHSGSTIAETGIKISGTNALGVVSGSSATIGEGAGTAYTSSAYGTLVLPSTSLSVAGQGGGAAHNNVQPTIILNYIIKT